MSFGVPICEISPTFIIITLFAIANASDCE